MQTEKNPGYGEGGAIEILITTFSAILHASLVPDTLELRNLRVIHEGAGAYYSSTWNQDHYFVLSRNYANPELGTRILMFDQEFRQVGEINCQGSIREGHQIRLVGDNLLVCNTNNNCLTTINILDQSMKHFYPLPASRDANFNHINSISFYGDYLWLVAANRFRNSFFMCFEYPSMRLLEIDAMGLAAHNIVEWRDWKVICDSFHGSLILSRKGHDAAGTEYPFHSVHLLPDSNEVAVERIVMSNAYFRERKGVPIFPRGLALSEDLALVGISEITRRAMRQDSLSQIIAIDGLDRVIDNSPVKKVRATELGRYGAVMDIRILNRIDHGHV